MITKDAFPFYKPFQFKKLRKKLMTALPVEIEIDRLLNLIRGFGWELSSKEITDDEVILKINKKISPK